MARDGSKEEWDRCPDNHKPLRQPQVFVPDMYQCGHI
jgi:hypothetical protein